jgi:hypothetical protein
MNKKKVFLLILTNLIWLTIYTPTIGPFIGLLPLILFPFSLISSLSLLFFSLMKSKNLRVVFLFLVIFYGVLFIPIISHYNSLYFNIDLADQNVKLTALEEIISNFLAFYKCLIPVNIYLLVFARFK